LRSIELRCREGILGPRPKGLCGRGREIHVTNHARRNRQHDLRGHSIILLGGQNVAKDGNVADERDGGLSLTFFVLNEAGEHHRLVILQHQDRFCRARTEFKLFDLRRGLQGHLIAQPRDLHLDLHHHFVHQIDGRLDGQFDAHVLELNGGDRGGRRHGTCRGLTWQHVRRG